MNRNLLVSIIVNNYNYDRFLKEAIDSALNQTYPHIEVIVVDDGSTDNSCGVIAEYGDRILPLFQPNGRQGAAFNNGFAHSNGDIIIFLDADDYLLPNAVECVVAAWKPDIAKVHYRLDVVDADRQPRGFSYPQGGSSLASGEVWRRLLQIGSYRGVPTSGNAISRHALAQVTPIPDEYRSVADDYLSVLIPLYGEVVAISEPLAAYRLHTNNQWALVTVSSDRFRRFVQHDLQRCELLTRKATALGYTVPEDLNLRFFGRAWSRLASLKLDPEHHLVPSDRSLVLSFYGIRALWRYSDFNLPKRTIFTLWFVWVGLMPRVLAEPAIVWLFAPQFRPKFVGQTLKRLRALVS
ncbi:MAG: glycosyltransferase [Stenomitos rutilans HA7619-LM2]|jgi:glycosyltransferase involved in cell wall biosynthesis|nr:glycosyltransferase [Stenomitos rutilans HA7619-LM2]